MTMNGIQIEDSPTAMFPDNLAESHLLLASKDAELDEARTELSTAMMRIARFEGDIRRIGETMRETAEEHDYCSVYDDTIDHLNARMEGGVALPLRTTEEVYSYVVTVTVSGVQRDSSVYSSIEGALGSSGVDQALALYLNGNDDHFDHIEVTDVRSYD